jgi:hypothetical protein
MKNINIPASEIVGELRRAGRMYEVLKRAEDMVMVLVNLEDSEKTIKKNIANAEKLLKSLEDKAIEVKSSMDKQKQEATESILKMQEEASMVRTQASDVLRKARDEAASLVAKAKAEVVSIQSIIDNLKKEEKAARQATDAVKGALDSMVAEMRSKREQLLKAFN